MHSRGWSSGPGYFAQPSQRCGGKPAKRFKPTEDSNSGLPGAPNHVPTALASFYGVVGSLPLTSTGLDTGLADQAALVMKDLRNRLTKALAVTIATAQLADLTGLLRTIFGGDFVALPRFTPPDFASLQTAFGESSTLTLTTGTRR